MRHSIKNAFSIFAFICLALGIFSTAQASETPAARTCRIAGGEAWVVNFSESEDVALCRFGSASIGAEEFAAFTQSGSSAASIRTFQRSTPSEGGADTCSKYGASFVTATDSDQVRWDLCRFGDGSVIEANTLAQGASSPRNASLAQALRK